LQNSNAKASGCRVMFAKLVELMNHELRIKKANNFNHELTQPAWI